MQLDSLGCLETNIRFQMSAGPETTMATFNDADDFNVMLNLSEKYINS